ncbi:MAG: magnesium/cobalt transporter CorA [Bdellovibrionia bacterium]
MGRLVKKSKRANLPPGTLVHVGEKRVETSKLTVFEYSPQKFEERHPMLEELSVVRAHSSVIWLNVDGISDSTTIEKVGKLFDLHPLTLEDIMNSQQRPKTEVYPGYVFTVLKTLMWNDTKEETEAEQISLVLGHDFIITFQEREGDTFGPIRERIRSDKGRLRKSAPDYLAYSLLDSIVDHYFVILERIGEKIEELDRRVLTNPTKSCLISLQRLKKEMLFVRRSIWPMRAVVGDLEKLEPDGSPFIHASTRVYLRDVYDHTIQLIETVETLRDVLSTMLEIYLSAVSHRLNEVLKLLAVISTIFMPLTFIVGLYGMNFKHMPELEWQYGYPVVLILMTAVTVVMLAYFKRKRFL